jgi:hypothetical protein
MEKSAQLTEHVGFCQSCSVSCGRAGEGAVSQPFRLGRAGADLGGFPVRGAE